MNELVAIKPHGFSKFPEGHDKGFGPGFTIIGDLLGSLYARIATAHLELMRPRQK
jgi:hypothetical protein